MFPTTSLTLISTVWLLVNVAEFDDTHVVPPLKLYGVACNPEAASLAVIVSVASAFVHDVGFPVTLNVGFVLSILFITILELAMLPAASLTLISTVWLLVNVAEFDDTHVVPPLKLYGVACNPEAASLAVIVSVASAFVHDVGFPVTLNVGFVLSILFITILELAMFPTTSLTLISTVWLLVNVAEFDDTHVVPPLKLYGVACNPEAASLAVIVSVASAFVHDVGFPVTLNVGFVLSILFITTLELAMFPTTSLTLISTVWLLVNVAEFDDTHVVPPLKLYGVACNPEAASLAVIVSVTSAFVHDVGFPATLNVGFVWSILTNTLLDEVVAFAGFALSTAPIQISLSIVELSEIVVTPLANSVHVPHDPEI